MYLQGSRKKGCRAHIEITQFSLYSEYSVSSQLSTHVSQKCGRKLREYSMKSLKLALNEGKVPEVVHKYCISLPTEEAHHQCHPTKGALGLSQRIHPELIAKIQEFVSAGTHEPVEIQRLLKHHVHYYMCAGNLPNPTNRAYYPLLDDIKNHVSRSKRAMQLSVLDQENAQKKIEQWKELSPTSRYHFRPYRKNNEESWQQQLMIMYGNTISLMDATYKQQSMTCPCFSSASVPTVVTV